MKQWAWLVLLAMGAGGCVSNQDATSSAVRILNAVPDGPRMSLIINGGTVASNYDYGSGTPYAVQGVGQTGVRIDEVLPSNADPTYRTIFDRVLGLNVNDELTLVVLGQAAGQQEEIVSIGTMTRGVPTGQTRIQFMNAGNGQAPVDVYLVPPGTLPSASTPIAAGLAYKAFTAQTEVTGGNSEIIVTAAGDPATVLLDTGTLSLPLEGTWLVVVIDNTSIDAATRPINLSILTGTGSAVIVDQNAKAQARFVNVSPGTYDIDSFVNLTTVDGTARQDCDPLTTEAGTLVEQCAQPFKFIGPFNAIVPGVYGIKTQKAADAAVTARTVSGALAGAGVTTFITDGYIADTDTATGTGLQVIPGARSVATAAQLRLANFSQGAVNSLNGDPTTDRLEFYIVDPCVDLADQTPDYYNVGFGSDTGYLALEPGDYTVALTRTDPADASAAPVVLVSKRMTLAGGGVYTELVVDSVGAVLPASFLSIDDDPGLQDCPAPP
jgi:hypothetical protein